MRSASLSSSGYDGWLSIEDILLSRLEGVRSVTLLNAVAPVDASDYAVQPV